MGLKNLLKNENTFNKGITVDSLGNALLDGEGNGITYANTNLSYGGPSKTIKYGENTGGRAGEIDIPSFHLTDRIEWYGNDQGLEGHEPTFLQGRDHKTGGTDFILRGGSSAFYDRRKTDLKRINDFLYHSVEGGQFQLRQGALQLLNSQPNTRTWNAGVSLLASIGAAGVSSFKRAGLIPEPADANINSTIGGVFGDSAIGGFLTNAMGGDYQSLMGRDILREQNFNTGDPGKPTKENWLDAIIDINPFKKKEAYNVKLKDSLDGNQIDLISYQDVFKAAGGNIPVNDSSINHKDMIPFRFEVIDSENPVDTFYIIFRAFLENFDDNYNATHNEIKYNGRGEQFYTYNTFKRTVNIGFKVAAQSRHEMKPLYKKLNYLVAQTAPDYSSFGRIRTPYLKLTMGDYLRKTPGIINNIGIRWNKDYPWEIKLDASKDSKMLILPHVLDVNLTFTPIHSFTPNNRIDAPFISINGKGTSNWLKNSADIYKVEKIKKEETD